MTQQSSLHPSTWRKFIGEESRQDLADMRAFWRTHYRAILISAVAFAAYVGIAAFCYVHVDKSSLVLFTLAAEVIFVIALVTTAVRRRIQAPRRGMPRTRA